MKKQYLVDEWRNVWKLYSAQIMGVLAALSVIEGYFHVFSVFLPAGWLPYITALFALAGILGRLLPQPAVVEEGIQKKIVAELETEAKNAGVDKGL